MELVWALEALDRLVISNRFGSFYFVGDPYGPPNPHWLGLIRIGLALGFGTCFQKFYCFVGHRKYSKLAREKKS